MFITLVYFGLPLWVWILIAPAAIAAVAAIIRLSRWLHKRRIVKRLVNLAGFAYDADQDIFYSLMDAWQRKFGYCYLYDEAAPLMNMIIDSDPIYFKYDGKTWLIELWKGQYGMTTGAEIGVYYTRWPVGKSQKARRRAFYNCVKDKDMLPMTLQLVKDGQSLFMRDQRHWWLTGFVPGEFSWPSDVAATFGVTFPSDGMRDAFTQALLDMGYLYNRFSVDGMTVWIRFTNPLSSQPDTRTHECEAAVQTVNKALCDLWQDITDGLPDMESRLAAVRSTDPELYKNAVALGKSSSHYLAAKKILRKERKTLGQ